MTPATLHEARLLAARRLLAIWQRGRIRSVRLDSAATEGPRVWPEALAPEYVRGAVWPVGHPDVPALLVATIAAGTRYGRWLRLLRDAERELGGAP